MSALIMVVDDDPSIVFMMKENLSSVGYRVVEGYDGETAVRLALTAHPELILMDLHMPGISGLEAFRQLRSNPATMGIPVLFLTGDGSVTLPPELAHEPATDSLPKTLPLEDLNKRIARMLAARPSR